MYDACYEGRLLDVLKRLASAVSSSGVASSKDAAKESLVNKFLEYKTEQVCAYNVRDLLRRWAGVLVTTKALRQTV